MTEMKETELVNIRKATHQDIQRIYEFERQYIKEHEPEQLSKWDTAKDKTIEQLFYSLDRMYVVRVQEKIVGHSYWSSYLDKPCIFSIYVLKEYRHKGFATAMMSRMEEDIMEGGNNVVTLSTLETNPAQHLFDSLGYVRVGITGGWIHYIKSLLNIE